MVLLIAKNNGGYLFLQPATQLQTETVWVARYAPNICENYAPDEADQFRKAKYFFKSWQTFNKCPTFYESYSQQSTFGHWIHSTAYLYEIHFNIFIPSTTIRLQPSVPRFSKVPMNLPFPSFSYMLHANLVLWSEDTITSQEKYTKPITWRTALGRKNTVPFPCWLQKIYFRHFILKQTQRTHVAGSLFTWWFKYDRDWFFFFL